MHGPRKCWIPLMTTELSNSSTAYMSMDGHSSSADDEREPMLPGAGGGGGVRPDDIPLYRLDVRQQSVGAAALALIPVIVPSVSAAGGLVGLQLNAASNVQNNLQTSSPRRSVSLVRRHSSNASNNCREVKFDETVL